MKRVFVWLIVVALLAPVSLLACDTNLISLISGNSAADMFVEKSSQLVALSVKLGQNIQSADTAKPVIQEIMNAWIAFDNNFSQFPPEWAKQDSEWKNKLKMLADIIGQIKFASSSGDLGKAHDLTLFFSKKLTLLYEKMPKQPLGQLLFNHSIDLIELNEAFAAKDSERFGKIVEKLSSDHQELNKLLEEPMKKAASPMGVYLQELGNAYEKNDKKLDFKVKMVLMTVEDAFVKMNENLKKSGKTEVNEE